MLWVLFGQEIKAQVTSIKNTILKIINLDIVRSYAELMGKNEFIYSFPTNVLRFFYLCVSAFLFILKGARMFQFVFSDPLSPSIELPAKITFINTKDVSVLKFSRLLQ